jgi:hypothetical protein
VSTPRLPQTPEKLKHTTSMITATLILAGIIVVTAWDSSDHS